MSAKGPDADRAAPLRRRGAAALDGSAGPRDPGPRPCRVQRRGGIHVSDEDVTVAVVGEAPVGADRDTWRAVDGYRAAMGYILQRRRIPSFTIAEEALLAAHFTIRRSDSEARPGRRRPGWVGVRDSGTGDAMREGVERDRLEPLVRELLG